MISILRNMPLKVPLCMGLILIWTLVVFGLQVKCVYSAPPYGLLTVLNAAEDQILYKMQMIMLDDGPHMLWTPLLPLPVREFMGKVVQNFVKALQHPADSIFQIVVSRWEGGKPLGLLHNNLFHPFGNVSFNFAVSVDLATSGDLGFVKDVDKYY